MKLRYRIIATLVEWMTLEKTLECKPAAFQSTIPLKSFKRI